jgi:bidirectional [NiFe] hydrogenase diaphorase subunit
LIEVLHTAQETFGYLDHDVLLYAARHLRLPLAQVYGVATFYHFFSLKPQGEHVCTVCLGTACYVKKSAAIMEALEQEFGIKSGQTTGDKKLSLAHARCVGSCGLAPLVVVDDVTLGRESPEGVVTKLRAILLNGQKEPVGG